MYVIGIPFHSEISITKKSAAANTCGLVAQAGSATVHSEFLWCVEALNLLVAGSNPAEPAMIYSCTSENI